MLLQIPTPDKLAGFDTLGPLAVAAGFIILIVTGLLTGKIVTGRQHDQLQKQLDEVKAERDEVRDELKESNKEIREIQSDFRRVVDDFKRAFDQFVYSMVGRRNE